jgi:hypothetical protein
MSRIKPYQGTSANRLSQLIRNAQTPVLPGKVAFTFGVPQPGTKPVPGATEVVVEASAGKRHDAPVTVNYKRLSVAVLNKLPPGELVPFDPMIFPTTMHGVLPQLNAGLGLDLVADEVEDVELPSIPINGITITIKDNSLAWLPGDYFFLYAPAADQPAGRGENGQIPTDERRRIRVLELPKPEPI